MRRLSLASGVAVTLLAFAGAIGAASGTTPLGRQIEHPNGTSVRLKGIDLRPDSIVLSVAIANPGKREIRLNGARSLIITDDANGVHFLNPPAGNPALRIPAGTLLDGDLVFVGPLSPAARQLRVASNEGIGSTDNPFDDTPVLSATMTAPAGYRGSVTAQANHPNGATLGIVAAKAGSTGCLVSLIATNGNDRAIRLNQAHSLILADGRGNEVAPLAPATNPDLTVAPGTEVTANLVFPCQKLDTGGSLTLTTNRGTGGTTDNPYETLPVFTLTLQPGRAGEGILPSSSRAAAAPIARSQLGPAGTPAQNAKPPADEAAAPAPAPTPPAPSPPPPAAPPAKALAQPSVPAPEAADTPSVEQKPPVREPTAKEPLSLAELKKALRAKTAEHGIRLVLPADSLFDGKTGTLGPEAEPVLTLVDDLIAKTHPAEVTIAGHTDSTGEDGGNQTLSEDRAKAVATWLADHAGKKRPRFVEQGFGRTRPVAANHNADGSDNPQGRAKNRRIEITLSKPAKERKESDEPDRKR